ncbi:IST1 homolog isoform X3 [Homarus americanus]|uniref:IST1 homolog isoform X3 n=1 Tax=Homarus americanus TaxID=6706 RepID=UPI001C496435|nr:IST1 homolog isoform X3 [Homarus americanus]
MFASGPNYNKLKTNLRLAINRLKLLEKKKTELAQKARKEIADYLTTGKTERAKIRVEHIIREDYLVEAMEVTEMYCDLLLARFGLIQQMKDLDEGLAEAISSLIWAAPRLQTDIAELKIIADQLTFKYGKPYGQACKEQQVTTISERLIHKLSVQAPPKVLVEKYLVEIAKNYNIEYEPDPQVMREEEWGTDPLISLDEKNNLGNDGATGGFRGGGGGGGGFGMNIPPTGFIGYPSQPMPQQPFSYPAPGAAGGIELNLPNVPGQPIYPGGGMGAFNIPPGGPPPPDPSADPLPEKINNNLQNVSGSCQWDAMMDLDNSPPPEYSSFLPSGHSSNVAPVPNAPYPSLPAGGIPARPQFPPDVLSGVGSNKDGEQPKPAPRSKFGEGGADFALPELPSVPDVVGGNTFSDPSETKDDIDFDDLTKRFEDLKKKK